MKAASRPDRPITEVIKSCVTGAELKTAHASQLVYKVPQEQAPNLSAMFAAIEARKADLGVAGVGISCTTMEEVFLKVGELAQEEKYEADKSSTHPNDKQQSMVRNSSIETLTYKKLFGLSLLIQQFKSLLHKRCLFTIRRPFASAFFFILPLFLLWVTIRNGMVDVSSSLVDPPLTLHLSSYGQTDAYVSGPSADQDIYKALVTKQDCKIHSVDNITQSLMKVGVDNIAFYKSKVIVAANFNTSGKTATAMYNGIAYHAAPISVNLITNSLLQADAKTRDNTITTINHPLDLENFMGACKQLNDANLIGTAVVWLILIPIGVKAYLSDLVTFPHNERTSNAKQLQLMTGVSSIIYWLACFVWDFVVYIVCCVVMMIVIFVADTSHLFTDALSYSVLFLLLLLFGVSSIFSVYVFSFLGKSSTTAGSVFTLITLITGAIAPLVMYFVLNLEDMGVLTSGLIKPIHFLLCLEPQYAFGMAILKFAYLLAMKSGCAKCQNNAVKEALCAGIDDKHYLSFPTKTNPYGILEYVMFLGLDWLLYFAFILLIERGCVGKVFHQLKLLWVGKDFDQLPNEDADVRDERDKVDASRDANDDSVVLTVDGVAKKFSRSFAAVQGVSFQVSGGECFGLLGVNGAGKTTTFRMLTGDETPTAGSAKILHLDLVRDRTKYLAQIGYCPQFDGINGFLTGEEVLKLFANLRGIPKSLMQSQIDDWISLLGLEEYRHRRCGKYSGGNKRKLSTAMALIGDPPLVFLDEPTTGVDPVARRKLWDVLMRCQKSGQAIVLTSHSMEECEALCTRLTIMVRGRMKCIGSNQYLKQRYGQGYTLMIKLHPHPDYESLLPPLKRDIEQRFPGSCTLKDEHKSLLHYHMTDPSIPLSKLFSEMEQVKLRHTIVEDYTVGDTTLEQVFIAFARQAEGERR